MSVIVSVSDAVVHALQTVVITVDQDMLDAGMTYTLEYLYGEDNIRRNIAADLHLNGYQWVVPVLNNRDGSIFAGTVKILCALRENGIMKRQGCCQMEVRAIPSSAPSVENQKVYLGDTVRIKTNRRHSSYVHRLYYRLDEEDASEKVLAANVEDKFDWILPSNILDLAGGEKEKCVTVRCETYCNGMLVTSEDVPDSVTFAVVRPNATEVQVSSGTIALGESVQLKLPSHAQEYRHDLYFLVGSDVFATLKGLEGGIHTWTVPESAAEFIRGTEDEVEVQCVTWVGIDSQDVGLTKTTFPVVIVENEYFKPKFNVAISAANTWYLADQTSLYLAGHSRIKVSYAECEAAPGAEISQCLTDVIGEHLVGADITTSSVIPTSGTVAVTCTVTDSRGFTSTKQEFIHVYTYHKPRIVPYGGDKKIICIRCDVDGTPNRRGTSLLVRAGVKFSQAPDAEGNSANACWLYCGVNKTDVYEEIISAAKSDTEVERIIVNALPNIKKSYSVLLSAMDGGMSVSYQTVIVPPGFAIFHSPKGGNGLTLGGYHEDGEGVFACLFDAKFKSDVSGRALGLGGLPALTDNNRTTPGAYAVADASELGLANVPGTLQVWNGDGLADHVTLYRMQKFIRADNEGEYQRSLTRSTPDEAWAEGPWKTRNEL